MVNVTQIIQIVVAAICAIVTTVVIPFIKSKTTRSQQEELTAWVRIAVTAAEQLYQGSGKGQEKKAYVLSWLNEHGIEIEEDKIDAMIESAVYDIKSAATATASN